MVKCQVYDFIFYGDNHYANHYVKLKIFIYIKEDTYD